MEENNIQKQELKPSLVGKSSLFNLIIPEEVEAKIRHLCNRVHETEWSGILFYKVKGIPGDDNFEATCKDILTMDIGSTGFTQFDYSGDVLEYKMEHPELLEQGVYEGLIHSHNNMQAFFSGTDTNTLVEEGVTNNHFLSLIVNNAGQYVARITRKVVNVIHEVREITTITESSFHTFEDNVIQGSKVETKRTEREDKEEVTIEYWDADIIKTEVANPFDEIDQRLATIKEQKSTICLNLSGKFAKIEDVTEEIPYNFMPLNVRENQKNLPLSSIIPSTSPIIINPNQEELNDEDEDEAALDFFENIYKVEEVPDEIIEPLCVKLLTGTVLLDNLKIPLDKWVAKLDSYYTKFMGDLSYEDNQLRLKCWLDSVIDAVITYPVNEEYEAMLEATYNVDIDYYDTDAFTRLYAFNIIEYLKKLPNSLTKDCIIEELETYLPKLNTEENAKTI